jgi:serine/threonine protein kinase
MAPEVLLPQVEYTYTSDLFSLGCVIHELLTGYVCNADNTS